MFHNVDPFPLHELSALSDSSDQYYYAITYFIFLYSLPSPFSFENIIPESSFIMVSSLVLKVGSTIINLPVIVSC